MNFSVKEHEPRAISATLPANSAPLVIGASLQASTGSARASSPARPTVAGAKPAGTDISEVPTKEPEVTSSALPIIVEVPLYVDAATLVTQGAGVPTVSLSGPLLPAETATKTPAAAAFSIAAVDGMVKSVLLPPIE